MCHFDAGSHDEQVRIYGRTEEESGLDSRRCRASRNKRDKDREKELFDVSFGEVQASTDMFPCPRCGKRDCR